MLASLAIREGIGELSIEKDTKLSARLGLGLGKVRILQVGGVLGRVEYILAGNPMEQAKEATQLGEHNDSIVISRLLNDIIETSFETQPVGNDHGQQFRSMVATR